MVHRVVERPCAGRPEPVAPGDQPRRHEQQQQNGELEGGEPSGGIEPGHRGGAPVSGGAPWDVSFAWAGQVTSREGGGLSHSTTGRGVGYQGPGPRATKKRIRRWQSLHRTGAPAPCRPGTIPACCCWHPGQCPRGACPHPRRRAHPRLGQHGHPAGRSLPRPQAGEAGHPPGREGREVRCAIGTATADIAEGEHVHDPTTS
jgi:hypothetical protein